MWPNKMFSMDPWAKGYAHWEMMGQEATRNLSPLLDNNCTGRIHFGTLQSAEGF